MAHTTVHVSKNTANAVGNNNGKKKKKTFLDPSLEPDLAQTDSGVSYKIAESEPDLRSDAERIEVSRRDNIDSIGRLTGTTTITYDNGTTETIPTPGYSPSEGFEWDATKKEWTEIWPSSPAADTVEGVLAAEIEEDETLEPDRAEIVDDVVVDSPTTITEEQQARTDYRAGIGEYGWTDMPYPELKSKAENLLPTVTYGSKPNSAWVGLLSSGMGPKVSPETMAKIYNKEPISRSDYAIIAEWWEDWFIPEVKSIRVERGEGEFTSGPIFGGPYGFTSLFSVIDYGPGFQLGDLSMTVSEAQQSDIVVGIENLALDSAIKDSVLSLVGEGITDINNFRNSLLDTGIDTVLADEIIKGVRNANAVGNVFGGIFSDDVVADITGLLTLEAGMDPMDEIRELLTQGPAFWERYGVDPDTLTEAIRSFSHVYASIILANQGDMTDAELLSLERVLQEDDASGIFAATAPEGVLASLAEEVKEGLRLIGVLEDAMKELGLPDDIQSEILLLLSDEEDISPIALLQRDLSSLGISDEFRRDLLTTMDRVAEIHSATLDMGVGVTGLSEAEERVSRLQTNLGLLSVVDLSAEVASAIRTTGLLHKALQNLHIPDEVATAIDGMLRSGSDLTQLGAKLVELGVPDNLTKNITSTLDNVLALGTAIAGMDIPLGFMKEISALLDEEEDTSNLTRLINRVSELAIPEDLKINLQNRLADVDVLKMALGGLTVPAKIRTDIWALLYSPGSDVIEGGSLLVTLRRELKALGLPGTLEQDLLDRIDEADSLQTILSALEVTIDLQPTVNKVDALRDSISALESAVATLNLSELAPDFARELSNLLAEEPDQSNLFRLKDDIALIAIPEEFKNELIAAIDAVGILSEEVSGLKDLSLNLDIVEVQEKVDALQFSVDQLNVSELAPDFVRDLDNLLSGDVNRSDILKLEREAAKLAIPDSFKAELIGGIRGVAYLADQVKNRLKVDLGLEEVQDLADELEISITELDLEGLNPDLTNDLRNLLSDDAAISDLAKLREDLIGLQLRGGDEPGGLKANLIARINDVEKLREDLSELEINLDFTEVKEKVDELKIVVDSIDLATLAPDFTKDLDDLLSQGMTDGIYISDLAQLEADAADLAIPQVFKDQLRASLLMVGAVSRRVKGLSLNLDTTEVEDLSAQLKSSIEGLDLDVLNPDLANDLRNLLSEDAEISNVAKLRRDLIDLELPSELFTELTDRLNEVGRLRGDLSSLVHTPEFAQLGLDLKAMFMEGSNLTELQKALPNLNLSDDLEQALGLNLRTAITLKGAIDLLDKEGIPISNALKDALNNNLDLLNGTIDRRGLIEILGDLKMPTGFSEALANRIDQVGRVESTILSLETRGLEVSSELRDDLYNILGLIEGPEGITGEGLIAKLDALKIPTEFRDALIDARLDVEKIHMITGPLFGEDEFGLNIPPQFLLDVEQSLLALLGDDDIPGIVEIIGTLGFSKVTLDSILDTLNDAQELNSLLNGAGIDPLVANRIEQALLAGRDLNAELNLLDIPEVLRSEILAATEDARGLRDILASSEEAVAGIMQLPEDFASRFSAVKVELGLTQKKAEDIKQTIEGIGEASKTAQENLADLDEQTKEIKARMEGFEDPVLHPDLRRALTRPQMAELEEAIQTELQGVIDDLAFDPEEYQTAQQALIEQRTQETRERLARQFGIDPGGEKTGRAQIQFETLEAERLRELRQLEVEVQDRIQAVKESTLAGLTNSLVAVSGITIDQQQLHENARQFDEDLRLRLKEYGLNETEIEAAVRSINAEILNKTRELSAKIAMEWAEITGEVGGGPGEIDADTLGLDLSELDTGLPFMPTEESAGLLETPHASAARASFEAMTGRAATDEELKSILLGEKVSVENVPTQRAREFAAEMTNQWMERTAKYKAIADQHALDRDKFIEAQEEADRQWNITTLSIAEEFGLDNEKFRLAKFKLDNLLSGLFFDDSLSVEERDAKTREHIRAIAEEDFEGQEGEFLRANDMFDRLYGNQRAEIARAIGIDAEKFEIGGRQAAQQETRMLAVWGSLIDGASSHTGDHKMAGDAFEVLDSAIVRILGEAGIMTKYGGLVVENVVSAKDIVTTFMEDATVDEKSRLATQFEQLVSGIKLGKDEDLLYYIFPDKKLAETLEMYLDKRDENLASVGAQKKATVEWHGVDANWFKRLSPGEQNAVMQMIAGANTAPERSRGPSILETIGSIVGMGVGIYTASKAGSSGSGSGPVVNVHSSEGDTGFEDPSVP